MNPLNNTQEFPWSAYDAKKDSLSSNMSLQPTICSSSASFDPTEDGNKSWSTNTINSSEATSHGNKFSYKEVLLMKDYNSCTNDGGNNQLVHEGGGADPCLATSAAAETVSTPNPGKKQQPKAASRKSRDHLQYTKSRTDGKSFTKLGGSRMDTTVVREAISQAISQGIINKSTKRELRQALMRGDYGSCLEELRRECHLQPLIQPYVAQFPTEFELRSTNGLVRCISQAKGQNAAVLAKKHVVLMEIQRLLYHWMGQVATLRHQKKASISFNVLTSGSWYLKVDANSSGLNIVVLVPLWVQKEDFQLFVASLADVQHAEPYGVTFRYHSVTVEVLLARFTQNTVAKNLPIHSDHVLSGMDYNSVKSLNGPRTAALILELVPNPSTFRVCLSAVRFWAKSRGLYSRHVGFLDGISWTVLVAFVCQMLPNATPSGLLYQFFNVLSHWKWPTPVLLSKPYDAGLGCHQWCPRDNIHDRSHVMPIITPGYPSVNSSSNVNFSTLRVLQEELMRGKILIDGMILKRLSSASVWAKLFEPTDFNIRYNHYLAITVRTGQDTDTLTRIRKLVTSLQHTLDVLAVHPLPTPMTDDATPDHVSFFVGFEIQASRVAQEVVEPVLTYFLATEMASATIQHCVWADLPESVFPSGKAAAQGERAKFVLRQAHDMHMMSRTMF